MLQVLQPIKAPTKILDKLATLEISNYWQLLLHIPLRYDDLTKICPIDLANSGMQVQLEGKIISCEVVHRRIKQLQVKITDGLHSVTLLFLNFYPNYVTQFKTDKIIRAFGEIKLDYYGNKTMIHPKIQSVKSDTKLSDVFIPVYSTTSGLKQKEIATLIKNTIADAFIPETLPQEIIDRENLLSLHSAITTLHNLKPLQFEQQIHLEALQRLKFDELLAQQLTLRHTYLHKHGLKSVTLKPKATYTKKLLDNLGFSLTKAQTKALSEIYMDISKTTQMHRLLQGDVGSGKTIVAALAMLVAVENGFQACIVAPTEILASQHYLRIQQLLKPLNLNVVWLSGSMNIKEKTSAYKDIATNRSNIIVGTHALLQQRVKFYNLALCVIDEQHRFGVEQRLTLQTKGHNPHQLMMSATPIPRTLAMSYYADLDLSIIDELPPGRIIPQTRLINVNRRHEVIEFIRNESLTRQVYWVCPLISESEKIDIENVENTYGELTAKLPTIKVGLMHSKLKNNEKAQIMQEFSNNNIQVLVSTTVIEVGVDIPNASIMVIENSERMGLSQLHQLRGRIGRGNNASQCILLYQEPLTDIAKKRLKVIYENTDGFKIAAEDLLIRGPGEILGCKQSGLPLLRFANLQEDVDLLIKAKTSAEYIVQHYPQLASLHVQLWFNNQTYFANA